MTQNKSVQSYAPAASLATMLNAAAGDLMKLAPKYVSVQRLMGLALEIDRRPGLAKVSPASVVAFAKKCCEWGTDRIGAGGVWPVPYWDGKNNCLICQPIPDWRLLVEKAKRSGCIKHAYADVVYAADVFSYRRGLNPDLTHEPALANRGDIVAAYAVFVLPDDTRDFVVMSWAEDIQPVRDGSQSWKAMQSGKISTCPWNDWPGEMTKKTVLKRALKLFEGASLELSVLLAADNAVEHVIDVESVVKPPIEMPKLVEAPKTPATGSTPQEAPEAGAPPENAASERTDPPPSQETGDAGAQEAPVVTGKIEKISTKPGGEGDKAWVKTGVMVGGIWYGTFDTNVAEKAKRAKAKGQEVSIRYVMAGQFRNIAILTVAGEAEAQEPGRDESLEGMM